MCIHPYLGIVGLALRGFLESKLKQLLLFLPNCKYHSLTGTEHACSLNGVGLLLVEFSVKSVSCFYIQNCKYSNLSGGLADTEPACLLGAVGLV